MAVPKYLPHENKVPYNVRLPKKLIDKLSAYAELTGNTTTNVITTALEQYMQDKTVFNDYLEIGGLILKIPYEMHQKEYITQKQCTILIKMANTNKMEMLGSTGNTAS